MTYVSKRPAPSTANKRRCGLILYFGSDAVSNGQAKISRLVAALWFALALNLMLAKISKKVWKHRK